MRLTTAGGTARRHSEPQNGRTVARMKNGSQQTTNDHRNHGYLPTRCHTDNYLRSRHVQRDARRMVTFPTASRPRTSRYDAPCPRIPSQQPCNARSERCQTYDYLPSGQQTTNVPLRRPMPTLTFPTAVQRMVRTMPDLRSGQQTTNIQVRRSRPTVTFPTASRRRTCR